LTIRRRLERPALGACASGLLAGCIVGPNFHPPPPPTVQTYTPGSLPAATAAVPGPGGGAQRFVYGASVDKAWWTLFGSPELDALEAEALKANPTLSSAQAALRQARETWFAQRATLFPTVALQANATRAKNSFTVAPPLNSNAEVYTLYTGQFALSYVVDVFGGVRRQIEATAAQAENQRFQTDAAYLTLTANVAAATLQLAGLNDQLAETEAVIAADRQSLAVTARQRRFGQAAGADVAAARASLEQAEQLAPPLQKQIDQQRDLLADLLGRPPSLAPTDRLRLTQFRLPADLPVTLPADLVRRRPDVLAAEANVHVASAQVGVAVAARLPSFTIDGALGGASTAIPTLLSNGNDLWSIEGGIAQTVFDAGALHHKEKAARAALDQAMEQYRVTVLAGLQGTADVLQGIVDDARALEHADAAYAAAADSLRISREEFAHGQVGALSLLTAQTALAQARVTLVQARAARYQDTVALYQALGGDWPSNQAQAEAQTAVPKP